MAAIRLLKQFARNWLLTFCVVLGAILGSTSIDLQPAHTNIDTSYTYIANSLALGTYHGKTIALTYGPLGWLIHSLRLQYLAPLAITVATVVGAVSGVSLYLLLSCKRGVVSWVLAPIVLLVVNLQIFEWKMYAVYLLAVLAWYVRKLNKAVLYGLVIGAAALLYAKVSLGIACVATLAPYILIARVNIRHCALAAATFFVAVGLFGMALLHSPSLVASYLVDGMSLSLNYSGSMGYAAGDWLPTVVFALVGIGVVLVGVLLFLPKGRRLAILPLVLGLLFAWKEGMVRQDVYGHVEVIPYLVAFGFVVAIVLWWSEKNHSHRWVLAGRYGAALVGGVGVFLVFWGISIDGYTNQRLVSNLVRRLPSGR